MLDEEMYIPTYQDMLDGMIERRMRSSIISVGSFWYTCWMNAGQPELDKMEKKELSEEEKKEQEAIQILLNAENEYSLAKEKSIEIGVASFTLVFLIILIHFKSNLRTHLTIPLFSICSIFLFLGIFTPMLEISASNTDLEIPIAFDINTISSPIKKGLQFLDDLTGLETAKSTIPSELKTTIQFKGKMYFYYQSKSIYQLIQLLFKDKNWLVGISILLFSILIPILKLIFTLT